MSDRPTTLRGAPSSDRIWVAAVVVLTLAILAQGVRALVVGWVPSGDNGFWSIMARSVFSSRPPLLGSSSSGGVVAGTGFHHLGPLGFYLLAPFVAVLGGAGAALGAAVINAGAAAVAALSVRAGAGERAGWIVVVGTALLAFTMGPELLVDPWNPHLSVLPLWCALCCTWAVLGGSPGWGAPGVLFASLALQTHLSFAPVAALAGLVLVVAVAVTCARSRRWSALAATAAAAVVANLVVLIEQFLGSGPGNLTNVLRGGSGQDLPIGWVAGARTVAQGFVPMNWLSGSWYPQVISVSELAAPWVVLVVLVVLGLVVADALRRGRRHVVPALSFVVVVVVVSVWVAAGLGIRQFGVPMALARWVWPVALLSVAVAFDAVVELRFARAGADRPVTDRGWAWRVAGLGAVVVLALANVVPRDEGSGSKERFREPIGDLLEQLSPRVDELGEPAIDINFQTLAAEATVAVMDDLDRRGIRFGLDDEVALRQAGAHRRLDGTETSTVTLRGGDGALVDPAPGYRVLASVVPLTEEERSWYVATRDRVTPRVAAFVDRLRDDPALRQRVGLAEDAQLEPDDATWALRLCGDLLRLPAAVTEPVALPAGVDEVEDAVIDDDTRIRLCELQDRLAHGAVALHVGPPPS